MSLSLRTAAIESQFSILTRYLCDSFKYLWKTGDHKTRSGKLYSFSSTCYIVAVVVVVSRIISWFRFEMAVGYIYMRLIKASAAIAGNWIVLTLYTNVLIYIGTHIVVQNRHRHRRPRWRRVYVICILATFQSNIESNPISRFILLAFFALFFCTRRGSPTARTKFVTFAVVFNILSTATARRNRLQSHRMETVSIFESWVCVYMFGLQYVAHHFHHVISHVKF